MPPMPDHVAVLGVPHHVRAVLGPDDAGVRVDQQLESIDLGGLLRHLGVEVLLELHELDNLEVGVVVVLSQVGVYGLRDFGSGQALGSRTRVDAGFAVIRAHHPHHAAAHHTAGHHACHHPAAHHAQTTAKAAVALHHPQHAWTETAVATLGRRKRHRRRDDGTLHHTRSDISSTAHHPGSPAARAHALGKDAGCQRDSQNQRGDRGNTDQTQLPLVHHVLFSLMPVHPASPPIVPHMALIRNVQTAGAPVGQMARRYRHRAISSGVAACEVEMRRPVTARSLSLPGAQ